MKILIFGASGATGHQLVKQGLELGHAVTAFVRNPEKLKVRHDNLNVVQGDVKDFSSVNHAVKGQDAVLSALGVSKPLRRDPVVVDGIRTIIGTMTGNGVKRLVYLSTNAVRDSLEDAGFFDRHFMARVVHNEIADHEEKEALIQSSALDWTIVRAAALTKGPHTGLYKSGLDLKADSFVPTISRADVAEFMLKQLTDNQFVRCAPRILP